ncbi:RNA polymerase sigma factor [Agathobaculum sp. Marseille-P7918]|uniref:RNA polymerase sigma factor n=1 Tax=Agathobaculum sp. Marseille-P7918 TaxID=2479843 RepID=UPI000F63D267|nr:sigma-70 family RNA polymerase sigma factor [Agathobaculum sp. Marseille-P7918]
MKYIPDDYGERCRFDAFCKTVLCNEAKTYLRDLDRQRGRETQFSALPQHEMDKLFTVDEYPSDSILFTAYGYTLHIRDELVAAAFASLPEQEQSILILHCVLELADGEIGGLAGMSRSAVQRHKVKTLNELRKDLQSKGVRNQHEATDF